ncbi:MAG: hypothetical protein KDC66_02870 [Phaeodactylibacter sp.]|nr:hypothetical protein [Phaeodactylibacter sp.]MCB9272863.1 hypothetical protein [Lewinellaceae bacterium]
MAYSSSTYHSRAYRDFKEIEPVDYRRIIRFYEEREELIQKLDHEECFELLAAYVNALFEVGAYQKHLLMVDVAIEMAIHHNIGRYQGEDIFHKLLFRKAASLYNRMEYERAEYILRELVRIEPRNRDAVQFLKKCLRRQEPSFVGTAKAGSILLFMLSAFIISLEVLFVRPFYKLYTEPVEAMRTVIFLAGWAVLLGGIALHRFRVERKVEKFVARAASKKMGNKLSS